MNGREELVASIVREVLDKLNTGGVSRIETRPASTGGFGIYPSVQEAVAAARQAQVRIASMSLEQRGEVTDVIRRLCAEHAQEWGRMELEETGIGRLEHKIEKLKLIRRVVGVEALESKIRTDTTGISILENAPFGVIAMALPATHSVPTMAGNAINVLAAGNSAVFTPHPAAALSAMHALRAFNREIDRLFGLSDLLCTIEKPTIEVSLELFKHPDIALICVTGGPAVVRAAMKAGKRVIAAGPGNPPVVVDRCAQLDKAARDIIDGASFDNNLLCIGEKEVFVVAEVADAFLAAMRRQGAVALTPPQIEELTRTVFTFDEKADASGRRHAHVRKEFIGRDAAVLAEAIGLRIPRETLLIYGETVEDHPFVYEEQMMPFLPVVRVPDIDRAIAAAARAERGYKHTALIHTGNIEHVARMARVLNTTLFVHNAPCSACLGLGGPGYLSYSIATPTGEGVTTPLTFTRQRQVTSAGELRIF